MVEEGVSNVEVQLLGCGSASSKSVGGERVSIHAARNEVFPTSTGRQRDF